MNDDANKLKTFSKISKIFILFGFVTIVLGTIVYLYVDEKIYDLIVLIIILVIFIIILIWIMVTFIIKKAYKTRKIENKVFANIIDKIVRIVLPVIINLARFLKIDKDDIRKFFIDINNIIVNSIKVKYSANEILILLPHCLQWSGCKYKLTYDPYNCRRCGKCSICSILSLCDKYKIKVCIASGGTLARKAVAENKPKMIIAVACNRDLVSGILDVNGIPVLAIENKRPEGPCVNTNVDICKIEQAIKTVTNMTG